MPLIALRRISIGDLTQVSRGTLELGRGLRFNLVVEGTKTLAELNVAEEMGGDSVQGYHYARPAPTILIPDMVKENA